MVKCRRRCKKNTWNIDHIIPQNLYNFSNIKEIKKCWNFKNLRPLLANENLIKSDTLNMDLVENYSIVSLLPENL